MLLPYDRWFAQVKRIYTAHGSVLGPIEDNENWRYLHAAGRSPEQAVRELLDQNT